MAEMRPVRGGITAKKNKIDVNYRNAEKCQMCDFFQLTACTQVEGSISPEGICNLWQLRSAPKYKDGQFYIDEFEKGKKV